MAPFLLRKQSISGLGHTLLGEETTLDYEEIESIPPLPLHALIAADRDMGPSGDADSGVSNGSSQNEVVRAAPPPP